jgi:hypothetical protein
MRGMLQRLLARGYVRGVMGVLMLQQRTGAAFGRGTRRVLQNTLFAASSCHATMCGVAAAVLHAVNPGGLQAISVA